MQNLSNSSPKLYPQDFILKYTILPFIPKWIKPNHVTILRFVLSPIVVYLLWLENYSIGVPFLIGVALTDAIDGSMARTRNQITDWGKAFDPLADKLLIGSSLIIVAIKYFFWTTMTVIIFEFAFIITGWSRRKRGIDISANIWGKFKMFMQVVGLVLILLALYLNAAMLFPYALISLFLAIILAVASFFTFGI
ncbi:CDP-alcohol phosphatidyltransferase family protein [Patescibacteria group bacterium]|nr:CDP-alcohol phosphatidyltransferase family protein [Patescibacteria group bacterium]